MWESRFHQQSQFVSVNPKKKVKTAKCTDHLPVVQHETEDTEDTEEKPNPQKPI